MTRLAALCLAALALAATEARAADYVSIVQEVEVARPPEAVWKKVGGYCDLGGWMRTSCEITAGKDGEVGAVRRIAGRIDEVLVARNATSYTYAQPKSPIDYHGTVEVAPAADGKGTRIVYSLFYDAESLGTAEAKAADRARRAAMFANVLKTMKTLAEAD
ncbi:SRPBCC family protein [Phenylobacterium sp.]|jgi:uncharacterized protein YndB with AHSA1/START domain|uniref:SRPBCC family protein n=1 Tax=Phenylobacterium sp. TaxID=1871053 RepID=UPI002E356B44|nr:SRPBCC family protein [Phenylobacterium sp.]HEX2560379.1 SRPBCC family protein [Phenylobacterium sp.]